MDSLCRTRSCCEKAESWKEMLHFILNAAKLNVILFYCRSDFCSIRLVLTKILWAQEIKYHIINEIYNCNTCCWAVTVVGTFCQPE